MSTVHLKKSPVTVLNLRKDHVYPNSSEITIPKFVILEVGHTVPHRGRHCVSYISVSVGKDIIIYTCSQITQHYFLLTGGAVRIQSGPLWLWAQHNTIPIVIQTISVIIFIISYSNNVLSSYRHFLKLELGELIHNH